MFKNSFYRQAIKMAFWIVVAIALTRVTKGAFAGVIALTCIWSALTYRRGLALSCFVLLPFMIIMNPLILPGSSLLAMSARFGVVLASGALLVASQRFGGKQQLPVGTLLAYLACAVLSSTLGYHPTISYFKIVNFLFFLACLYFGTRNLHHNPKDVAFVRTFFFALAIIVVLGSLATIAVPSVGYYVSIKNMIADMGAEAAAARMKEMQGLSLFCGVTNQSQVLAPMLACIGGLVVCDMICVERRAGSLHVLLLGIIPVLLFMTRSRAGFLAFVVMVFMVFFHCLRKIRVPFALKGKMKQYVLFGVLVVVAAGGVMQIRNQGLSRFLRKTEDVSGDHRKLSDAFTGSRQGLINESMRDFARNPVLGKGFQVAEYMWVLEGHAKKSGFVLSAPIEKGFMPAMVLGEGGLVGAIAFLFFMFCFWYGCQKKGYVATWTLFVVFLTTNFAEATFFSPGGMGGILWLVTVVGGFIIDLSAKGKIDLQQFFAMPPPEMGQPNARIGYGRP